MMELQVRHMSEPAVHTAEHLLNATMVHVKGGRHQSHQEEAGTPQGGGCMFCFDLSEYKCFHIVSPYSRSRI